MAGYSGRRGPLTEVDVLGVRLPHSTEFRDDPKLNIPQGCIDIVFAEAKGKRIEVLNGPWSSPEKGALDYVLKHVGVVQAEQGNSTMRIDRRNKEPRSIRPWL